MDKDERDWIDGAIQLCKRATEQGVLVLLIRRQDQNGLSDAVATNAVDKDLIRALDSALYEPTSETEE